MSEDVSQYWQSAAGSYRLMLPPLIPSEPDLAVILKEVSRLDGAPRVLQLGVTPALATLPWPNGTRLLAVDRSGRMVSEVWPGNVDSPEFFRVARVLDWFDIEPSLGGFNLILGDAALNNAAPDEPSLGRLLDRFRELIVSDGVLVFRIIVVPERHESPDEVIADLESGAIENFHIFRWRLAMALQPTPGAGIPLDEVWKCWNSAEVDVERLCRKTGWPVEMVQTINLYRDQPSPLFFPSRDQLMAVFGPRFQVDSIRVPDYEMGDRCPTFVLRPV